MESYEGDSQSTNKAISQTTVESQKTVRVENPSTERKKTPPKIKCNKESARRIQIAQRQSTMN